MSNSPTVKYTDIKEQRPDKAWQIIDWTGKRWNTLDVFKQEKKSTQLMSHSATSWILLPCRLK